MSELQARLRRLERRDWWLWGTAIAIMILLSVAIISFSFRGLWKDNDLFLHDQLEIAVRALLGMVLLFSTSTVYQQVRIHRLRARLTQEVTSNLALQNRAEVLEKLAILDPLTGLYNRRFATEHLPVEIARAQRQTYPLTVLMLDLDRLKQINDVYGHAAGDLVLQEFARRTKKAFRSSDLVVRMGGDEFMVLLPECGSDAVPHALARLKDLRVNYGGQEIPFTAAAGWADYQSGESLESLLERADQALYVDKQTGVAEAQAREADARDRQAQKLQIVGQLTGSVVHDFSNLLQVIKGSTQFVAEGLRENHPLRERVQQIQAATERATALVSRLLAFSRRQVLRADFPLDLNLVVGEMSPMLETLLGRSIRLVKRQGHNLGAVRGDAGQVEQVIMNLALNARDAMSGRGCLTLATENIQLDDEFARTNPGARSGLFVCLSVSDTGAGIDPGIKARIFEPFFTTKQQQGTGMGLAIVYGIVKQMGGYIAVESQPGEGSTFAVYFPRYMPSLETSRFRLQGNAPVGAEAPAVRPPANIALLRE